MPAKAKTSEYVLMPPQGFRASSPSVGTSFGTFLTTLSQSAAGGMASIALSRDPKIAIRVIDHIQNDGPTLVEISAQGASALRAAQPGLRLVPVTYFYPAIAPRPELASQPAGASSSSTVQIRIKVVSQADGSPVAGASVTAFTNYSKRLGASGTTNSRGLVSFRLSGSTKTLGRIYVFAQLGYWGCLKRKLAVDSDVRIEIRPIDLGCTEALRHFYGTSSDTAGANVRVGVIDTGVAKHPDLSVSGGLNVVTGEPPDDFYDNGTGHGTHVAGIIAAHGSPPSGFRGLAPSAELRSYRIFGKDGAGATNFAIAKAIDTAVTDGCDILNLSIGGSTADVLVRDAISLARASGTLVIAAAGNDGHQGVSFPASDQVCLAVAAMGRTGTFPQEATQWATISARRGADRSNFVASFSNWGPEIDLIAPGVGIISTFPGGYAVMDGTSMACPVITGLAAKSLGGLPAIAGMARDQDRSDALAKQLLQNAKPLGFGLEYEGQGFLV